MNALAWYYEQYEKNYQQAVLLWEQADELQSPDAPLNLGVMYANGVYPGKAADQVSTNQSGVIQKLFFFVLCIIICIQFLFWQFMAYKYYLKAAQRGNIRGATILADIWTVGISGYVLRRPEDAVL